MIDATSAAAATTTASTSSANVTQASGLTSDFNTFLQMLTAQARYQDPLEPIDSTEYAAQLAQFSMVEQQVQTNDTLTALITQMGTANMASLSGWVGMEVRAPTPMFFDGSPITVSPNPASVSDQVILVVSDLEGNEVQRMEVPVSAEPIEWAGVDDDGSPFSNGTYQFTIESHKSGELLLAEAAEVYSKISEAQVQGGAVVLILEGGQAVLASSVSALREPG